MLLNVYSIRDAKAETFSLPFYQHNDGLAERNFRNLVNEPNSHVNKNPEDFDLYHLGSFDDNVGKFTPLDTAKHLCKAINLIAKN